MVRKRDGKLVRYDGSKIRVAISKAFQELGQEPDIEVITSICEEISSIADKGDISVEEIQDAVEDMLMASAHRDVARAYVRYRYKREEARTLQANLEARNKKIRQLICGEDEESKTENSNKDTRIIPTMRDYIAGFTCRELAEKVLLPKDVAEAHKVGVLHFHDSDYSPAMPMNNCGLINLKDMFENGTVISGVHIHTPHSLRTIGTLTTQIITQVASSQYGGNTISLAHLAPFVDVSRQSFKKNYPELSDEVIERMVDKEIRDCVQTIQYQLITMSTTNG